jgi:hypothetical protein
MKVKNRERIERMVISLEAILETEKGLDYFERTRIEDALYPLKLICGEKTEKEFDEDDLRV